jgi:hypothetical protein
MKALLVALCLVVLFGCSGEQDSWPRKQFSAEDWRMTAESDRYVFAHDLIERYVLIGKRPDEVKELLGTPSSEVTADHYFTYVIKTGGDGFNQVYVLDVKLNSATGAVERVTIRGD